MIRRLVAVVATLVVALGLEAPATAQKRQTLEPGNGEDWPLHVNWMQVLGGRDGGTGYLLVEIENPDGNEHGIEVGYRTTPYSRGRAEATRRVRIPGGGRARLFLPMPTIEQGHADLKATVGGVAVTTTVQLWEPPDPSALLVTRRPEQGASIVGALGGSTLGLRVLDAADLPPDWTLLTTFDLVFVDASIEPGDAEQELLRRFAAGGGRVIAAGADRWPAGPLRDLRAPGNAGVPVGLGVCAFVDDWRGVGTLRSLLPSTVVLRSGGSVARQPATITGPLPSMHAQLDIPGLGTVPAKAFLLLILLFAIVVGPVNFAVARRRRQPMLVLATLPVLGALTTLLILGYGVFHDGFGIRGCRRSVTVLDQARHEAATIAGSTLFAGLAPSRLAVPAGAVVECLDATMARDRGNNPHSLTYDASGMGLDGGVLPSRTTTTLVTRAVLPARERLQFQRAGNGYDVIAEPGFRPVPDGFVLRTADGAWYRSRGNRLDAVHETAGRQALAALTNQLARGTGQSPTQAGPTLARGYPGSGVLDLSRADLGGEFGGLLDLDEGLAPGSYAGFVESAPWLPDLGIDAELHRESHFVIGRLGPGDVR